MSPTPPALLARRSAPPPGLSHFLKRGAAGNITTANETLRQQAANRHFASAYQYILVGFVAVLALRNVCRIIARHNRAWRLAMQKLDALQMERLGEQKEGYAALGHRATWSAKVDAVVFLPLRSKWALGLENPLQVFFVVASFAINIGFVLGITMDYKGPQDSVWNTIHVVALRCGWMSMAQLPAVIALTGRNSLVQFLTGIEYQHLRFVHKLLAVWMALLGVVHTLDATFANFKYFGGAGVNQLYLHNYLGQTGIAMIVGLFLLCFFAWRPIRMRWYELFLVAHVVGVIMVLVGIIYHVPSLKVWLYVPLGFWIFERLARLLQLVSISLLCKLQFRKPLIKARATLIEGAVVLHVPFKGEWNAGQHAYLSFWDPSFITTPWIYFQSHPFSISNVPSCSVADEQGRREMLFVMRTRDGMTKDLARRLAKSETGSAEIWTTVEGPYGGCMDTEQFHEILLIAGGSGISHIMSMLADILHKARNSYSRATRVRVVWTVQNIEQSVWTLKELLHSAKTAYEAGVQLEIELYVTRGMAAPSPETVDLMTKELPAPPTLEQRRASFMSTDSYAESPIADALTILPGRPAIDSLVPRWIANAHGKSLVVACGPTPMAQAVRLETTKYISVYPVSLEIALFEC
ncbi:ferric-chelate reductase [Rhodotorula kratochvilovae]